MLAYAAFADIVKNGDGNQVFVQAQVRRDDPKYVQDIYNDKNKPRVWNQLTTANEGELRIMGALAHDLVGYSGEIFKQTKTHAGPKTSE
jgi:hypothetical protein